MRPFDYSFQAHALLPVEMLNTVAAISRFQERAQNRKSSFPKLFQALEQLAKIQSVRDSNEIEGIVTSEQRLHQIVSENSAPLNHSEAEIAGYRDALDLIHRRHSQLSVSEADILRLHKILASYLAVETAEQGRHGCYKRFDNVIIEVDSKGSRRLRFTPTPAAETLQAMEQLLLAYQDARDTYSINHLLLIPCFILDLLCIHPFADGNGRISRLLCLLLLYQNEHDVVRYISFEAQINHRRENYYRALEESSSSWHTGDNSYLPFIQEFLVALLQCYRELERRFSAGEGRPTGSRLSKRQRVEAAALVALRPISKREIRQLHPDISPSTVEAVLGDLLRSGAIEKVGAGRSTAYLKS